VLQLLTDEPVVVERLQVVAGRRFAVRGRAAREDTGPPVRLGTSNSWRRRPSSWARKTVQLAVTGSMAALKGRRMRSAPPTNDPVAAPTGSAPTRRTGADQTVGPEIAEVFSGA